MSAGSFVEANYTADNGTDIYPGTVQPETFTLTVSPANGDAAIPNNDADNPNRQTSFRVSKTSRETGVGPRKARFKFTAAATLPTGYAANQTYALPVFTRAFYDQVSKNISGTYQGQPIRYIGKTPESIR